MKNRFFALMALLACCIVPVNATVREVQTALDSGPGSLRARFAASAPGDSIVFADSLSGDTIPLATPLVIDRPIHIAGGGVITLSGRDSCRVLSVVKGPAFLSGLSLCHGLRDTGSGIANFDSLSLVNCRLSENMSRRLGGGIYSSGLLTMDSCTVDNNAAGYGGGLFNKGRARISASSFTSNKAFVGGGLNNAGHAEVTNSSICLNEVGSPYYREYTEASGGGCNNVGYLSLTRCSISWNSAISDDYALGGGICSSSSLCTLQVVFSTVASNYCSASGSKAWAMGGGIYCLTDMVMLSSTVAGNSLFAEAFNPDSAHCWVAGVYISCNSDFIIANSIIAGNHELDTLGRSSPSIDIDSSGKYSYFRCFGYGNVCSLQSYDLTHDKDTWQKGSVETSLALFGTDDPAAMENGAPTRTVALAKSSGAAHGGCPTGLIQLSDSTVSYAWHNGTSWIDVWSRQVVAEASVIPFTTDQLGAPIADTPSVGACNHADFGVHTIGGLAHSGAGRTAMSLFMRDGVATLSREVPAGSVLSILSLNGRLCGSYPIRGNRAEGLPVLPMGVHVWRLAEGEAILGGTFISDGH